MTENVLWRVSFLSTQAYTRVRDRSYLKTICVMSFFSTMPLSWYYGTCYINMFTYRQYKSRVSIVIYLWTNISSIDRTQATIDLRASNYAESAYASRESRNAFKLVAREKKDTIDLFVVDWRTRLPAIELAGSGNKLRSCDTVRAICHNEQWTKVTRGTHDASLPIYHARARFWK